MSVERYLQIIAKLHEPLGDWRRGEIQIVTDPEEIERIEAVMRERFRLLREQCGSEEPRDEWAQAGIVAEDEYLIHLRDPVLFPPHRSGDPPTPGLYNRIIYRERLRGNPSVCLLVVDPENRIILNRAYRHTQRCYTIETPGTIARKKESLEDTIQRCIREEIGMDILAIHLLTHHGGFISERGFMAGAVPIYLVVVDPATASAGAEFNSSVRGHIVMSKEEFLAALRAGECMREGTRYLFNDGYTNTAFLLAQLNGFL